MTDIDITPTAAEDIEALQAIVHATGLFPPNLVPDLLAPVFAGETSEFWRTARMQGTVVGFCYTVPEMLAEGAWNITAIAVAEGQQGRGIGKALLGAVEDELRGRGQRLIIVDTSSTEDFTETRAFYLNAGYEEEARIRDFWALGDDKVVFRKAL
ncbi:MAG: GNAT family N-acetyltransferase [Pseudomonadota bacterium]